MIAYCGGRQYGLRLTANLATCGLPPRLPYKDDLLSSLSREAPASTVSLPSLAPPSPSPRVRLPGRHGQHYVLALWHRASAPVRHGRDREEGGGLAVQQSAPALGYGQEAQGAWCSPPPLLPWLLVGCLLAWLPVLCLLVVSLRDMSNTTSSYFCRRSNYKAPQCLLRRHRRRLRRRTALSRSVAPNLSHSSRTT